VIRRQKGKTYLVCEMARHGSCANRRYFPYARLEDFVLNFAGAGIGKMLTQMTPQPEQPDSPIPELENRLADLRMNRRRLMERFGEGDEDAAALIDKLADQIREVENALTEARQDDLIARHSDHETFLNRWRIAKLKLATGDRDARIEMATLLKQRVRSVVLIPEKHLIVTFTNNRRNSPTIKVEIRTDGQKLTIN